MRIRIWLMVLALIVGMALFLYGGSRALLLAMTVEPVSSRVCLGYGLVTISGAACACVAMWMLVGIYSDFRCEHVPKAQAIDAAVSKRAQGSSTDDGNGDAFE